MLICFTFLLIKIDCFFVNVCMFLENCSQIGRKIFEAMIFKPLNIYIPVCKNINYIGSVFFIHLEFPLVMALFNSAKLNTNYNKPFNKSSTDSACFGSSTLGSGTGVLVFATDSNCASLISGSFVSGSDTFTTS